jgi:hypothetical protein
MTLLRFDPLLIATSGFTALYPAQFVPHITPTGEEPTCSSADSRVLYGWLVDGPNGPEIHLRDGVYMTLVDYDAAAAYAPNGTHVLSSHARAVIALQPQLLRLKVPSLLLHAVPTAC